MPDNNTANDSARHEIPRGLSDAESHHRRGQERGKFRQAHKKIQADIIMANRIFEEDVKTIAEGIAKEAPKLSGATVLITGGAGFLGNYFLLTIDYLNRHVLKK